MKNIFSSLLIVVKTNGCYISVKKKKKKKVVNGPSVKKDPLVSSYMYYLKCLLSSLDNAVGISYLLNCQKCKVIRGKDRVVRF